MCVRVTITNKGPEESTVHLLPTLWFRNTWVWEVPETVAVPSIEGVRRSGDGPARLIGDHETLGRLVLSGEGDPVPLACDNQTNEARLTGGPTLSRYPKDGINDHVVSGADTVNPDAVGTKAALHYTFSIPPGESVQVRLRLSVLAGDVAGDPFADFEPVMDARRREADEFYQELIPATTSTGRGQRGAPGDRRADVGQAVLQLRRAALARWRPGRAAAAGQPPVRAQFALGAHEVPRRDAGARTPGSTRGSPPGTWHSTAWPSPAPTRRSPRARYCCYSKTGTCTATARCRPTSGRSAT